MLNSKRVNTTVTLFLIPLNLETLYGYWYQQPEKLQPHWDGKWIVSKVKGPSNLELTDGHQSKIVHVNHVQHRIQPDQAKGHTITEQQPLQWNPPEFHHLLIPEATVDGTQRRYPLRDMHPPDRLRF